MDKTFIFLSCLCSYAGPSVCMDSYFCTSLSDKAKREIEEMRNIECIKCVNTAITNLKQLNNNSFSFQKLKAVIPLELATTLSCLAQTCNSYDGRCEECSYSFLVNLTSSLRGNFARAWSLLVPRVRIVAGGKDEESKEALKYLNSFKGYTIRLRGQK